MKKSWPGSEEIREPQILSPQEALCQGDGPFRHNAAALILRRGGREILLGERFDTPGCWQWPQGGLKKKEKPEDGLRRELREEIGVTRLQILYCFPFRLRYRFPRRLSAKFAPRIGQEQRYFLLHLLQEPDLDKGDDEFRELRWFPTESAADGATWFKRGVYEAALAHLFMILPNWADKIP